MFKRPPPELIIAALVIALGLAAFVVLSQMIN
jgi:hypothetical protein